MRLTPERKNELKAMAKRPGCPECDGGVLNSGEVDELLGEIDALREEKVYPMVLTPQLEFDIRDNLKWADNFSAEIVEALLGEIDALREQLRSIETIDVAHLNRRRRERIATAVLQGLAHRAEDLPGKTVVKGAVTLADLLIEELDKV